MQQFASFIVFMWSCTMHINCIKVPGPCGNENDTYMFALGFEKTSEAGRFRNGHYEVWDVVPRNVLMDNEGDIYVVGARIILIF